RPASLGFVKFCSSASNAACCCFRISLTSIKRLPLCESEVECADRRGKLGVPSDWPADHITHERAGHIIEVDRGELAVRFDLIADDRGGGARQPDRSAV